MAKELISLVSNLVSLTLPFFMITATFVGLAYTYGHSFTPFHMDECFEVVRLTHGTVSHL